MNKRRVFRKFNQEHGEGGRFTGPGGSHDPTGNPVGRPPGAPAKGPFSGHQPANYGREPFGRSAAVTAGGLVGNVSGELAGKSLGATVGGLLGSAIPLPIVGTVAGAVAGAKAGQLLGGLAGDYVGAKIAASLYDLKQQWDGHHVGNGKIGELTPGDQAAMVGSYLGGTASWLAFGGRAGAAAERVAGRYLAGPGAQHVAGVIGHVAADEVGGTVGAVGGRVVEHARAGKEADRVAGRKNPASMGFGKARFMKAPATASFTEMVDHAIPTIMGPKAWERVKSTPFGHYIEQRVKETAEKLDDAAAIHDVDLKPSKQTAGMMAAANMQMAQMHAQTMVPAATSMAGQPQPGGPGAPPPGGGGGPPAGPPKSPVQKLFRKAHPLLFRASNDCYYGDPKPNINTRMMTRLDAADTAARNAQLSRAYVQPRVENLTPMPNEDEVAYRKRIQRLMSEGKKSEDKGRPMLFNGGQTTIYRVRKRSRGGDPVGKGGTAKTSGAPSSFKIEAEIAKGLNPQIKLDKGLVYGWASIIEKDGQEITDHQGDRIVSDELVKAAHDFVSNSRQGGVLHDEYGHQIGHIVESVVFTKELQSHLKIDLGKVGWLIGYQITDPRVKAMAKMGVLKAFSIGGKGKREPANA